ncbi:hypothetical protein FS749_000686 [Ceratobasidium sp. UAMH 11750]|nr:hypothetical protein FS749_000686 [Ceratobasidium sp. UAMH 11750]
MVWRVWSVTWSAQTNAVVPKEPLWYSFMLLGSPYIIWGVEAAIFAALQTNSRIYRVTFYCISDNQSLGVASGALAAVLCILCLIFQAWAMIIVYRRYRISRRLGRAEIGDVSIPFFARIMSFSLILIVGLVLCLIATSVFALDIPDIMVSSMGVLMFFIFASQEDVLVAWRVMRPKPCSSDTEAVGVDVSDGHSIHGRPTTSLPSPPPWLFPVFNLPMESKAVHRFAAHVQRTEVSPTDSKFDSSVEDNKSIRDDVVP